ncbi:DUF3152 domain-containing protein [Streptomyces sp. VNUA24]|uniref:DUF3152 domain-containing protein n=1 Tax=Streptomyces sp. VNUA24 TaxID=3031131 RepID=UPI0023B7F0C7|nr:DUF3152 domain-containing protein [Streptomyces sp. VNUA24]WEH15448.1 DUF3152 domain-containing protein [Streptomyces sp. VNUA24]
MGRHSRKGRAPKGDTNEKPGKPEKPGKTEKTTTTGPVTSAWSGDGPPAARRTSGTQGGPGVQGVRGMDGYGRPHSQGMQGFTGGAPGQQGARLPDGTPAHGFPRLPEGVPAHAVPRFADGTPAHGFPRLPDGTPAHGMARLPDGTPAHGFPRLAGGASAHGYPPSRGEHPEQREAGGGWGHLGADGRRTGAGHGVAHGAPAGAPYGVPGEAPPTGAPYGGPPERSGRRIPIPRQRQETMPSGGPRQAYLDAFDEVDDAFAPGRTPRAASDAADGRTETALREKPLREGTRENPQGRPEPGERLPRAGAEPGETAKAGKGRAFAGIAAAAVTTVLAVVVGGQIAAGQDDAAPQPQAADAGEREVRGASRGDDRPTPSGAPSPSVTPLSYDQKMDRTYPLAADLEGGGKFEAVKGFAKAPGKGQKYRYRVDVEKGLGLDPELFAEAVQKTLNDERSWAHGGGRTFERISSGTPDFVITLASPGTTATWCAKSGLDTTVDNVSCDSAATERVMINAYRWAQGSKTYGDQIHAYRQMLINHEIGHRLGYSHVTCDKDGELAPVMQQQSKFLTYDGITCKANPWAYPGS